MEKEKEGKMMFNNLNKHFGYFEELQYETCLTYFYTFIASSIIPCAVYIALMPSARNCMVNSNMNERKDILFLASKLLTASVHLLPIIPVY